MSGSASADDAAPKDVALKLFRDSDDLYRRGEFEGAIELLRQSYDIYPEPIVLYNLARALEGLGDFTAAVAEYQRYLDTGKNINDRRGIERRIVTLRAYIGAAGEGTNPAPHTSTQIGASAPGRAWAGSPVDRPSRRRWVPWAVTGTGVGLAGLGGVLAVMSDRRHDAAVREPVQLEAARLQDEAESLSTTATVFAVGGGVIAVGGVVWSVLDWRRHRRGETARPGAARLRVGPAYVGVEWVLP